MNRKQRRAALKQRRAAHIPKLTPNQVAKLRSEGNTMVCPVRTTKLVRQMFGSYTDQLAADLAAKAIKGAIVEGSERGFEALLTSAPPSNLRFRVAVFADKSFLIGFDHDPEYDDALLIVDDAGNVIKDDAGNPITPDAWFTACTKILLVENEDTETMLRELRPTEVWRFVNTSTPRVRCSRRWRQLRPIGHG
jgi:hypothetical protein